MKRLPRVALTKVAAAVVKFRTSQTGSPGNFFCLFLSTLGNESKKPASLGSREAKRVHFGAGAVPLGPAKFGAKTFAEIKYFSVSFREFNTSVPNGPNPATPSIKLKQTHESNVKKLRTQCKKNAIFIMDLSE